MNRHTEIRQEKMMQRTYYVEGKWPFPMDMLRHDRAVPATAAAADLIERLSRDYTEGEADLHEVRRIALVMESGEPSPARPEGRYLPNDDRWRSFGWRVIGVPEIDAMRAAEAEAARSKALRESGLGKLTDQEKQALGLK